QYVILVHNPHPYKLRRIVEVEFILPEVLQDGSFVDAQVFSGKKAMLTQVEKETSNKAGEWQLVTPLKGTIDTEVLNEVIDAVAALEAMEIKSQGADNPASFGLDESASRLTFGLTDGTGIRKTLLMGFRAGSSGVYAMIQGQDVIFILPMKLVGRMLRDLVTEEEHGS
ncbi:MAG: DUF4340 domain-containing protein, partial [bacterium]